jgi:hypothetical protein
MQLHTGGEAAIESGGRHVRSSVEPIALGDIESSEVALVVRAWQKWRGFHAMPARSKIDPRDLGAALRNVSLVAVVNEGDDYDFRVIGDAHVEAYGRNFTGRSMRDVIGTSPKFGRLLKASFDLVRSTGRPYAFRGTMGYDAPDANFAWFETCYLPFGEAGMPVSFIVNAASYRPPGAQV